VDGDALSAWFVIPSARPVEEAQACFDAWRAVGFKTAAVRDDPNDFTRLEVDYFLTITPYPGWATSINRCAKEVLASDPECVIIASGGDDVWPDSNFPVDRVESEFRHHFNGWLGVMQATGAVPGYVPWSKAVINGRAVQERVAWAPMIGRDWCLRAYGGNGPFWPEYRTFFADESLQVVAEALGLYWQRPDMHMPHKTWKHDDGSRPHHLLHTIAEWEPDAALFNARKAAGFPGHELLE
jgi:hypothetical protein